MVLCALGSGCAQMVQGTPSADPVAVQQVAAEAKQSRQVRECDAATDAAAQAVASVIRRGEVDLTDATAAVEGIIQLGVFGELGNACGPQLIGPAYSRLLVDTSELTPSTYLGRGTQNATLNGMCSGVDPSVITLNPQAQIVCAGR